MSDAANSAKASASDHETTADLDDLGRLRGILYGDHARQTSERIDTLEKALLGVIADLRSDVTAQLGAIESRLESEAATRTSALNNVGSRIDSEASDRAAAVKAVQKDLASTSQDLTSSIDHASSQAESALASARADLTDQMQKSESELRSANVDRATLASMFERVARDLAGD